MFVSMFFSSLVTILIIVGIAQAIYSIAHKGKF